MHYNPLAAQTNLIPDLRRFDLSISQPQKTCIGQLPGCLTSAFPHNLLVPEPIDLQELPLRRRSPAALYASDYVLKVKSTFPTPPLDHPSATNRHQLRQPPVSTENALFFFELPHSERRPGRAWHNPLPSRHLSALPATPCRPFGRYPVLHPDNRLNPKFWELKSSCLDQPPKT